MITRETAVELALKYFKELKSPAPHAAYIAVDETRIIETSFAWILQWNDRRYLETGDFQFELQGNQPLAVLKRDGTVMRLPALPFRGPEWVRFNSKGPHGTIEHRIAHLAELLDEGRGDNYVLRRNT